MLTIKRVEIGNDKTGYATLSHGQFGAHILEIFEHLVTESDKFAECKVMFSFEAAKFADSKTLKIKNMVASTHDRSSTPDVSVDKDFLKELKKI